MSCESYDLRLTTLSPIHIGSGKSYSCCEFVPAKAKSKGQIVKIIKRVNLTNYYSSLSDDRKDTFLASLTNSNFELKQFDKKIKKLKKFKKGVDIFENLVYHKEVLRQDITKDKVPWSSG